MEGEGKEKGRQKENRVENLSTGEHLSVLGSSLLLKCRLREKPRRGFGAWAVGHGGHGGQLESENNLDLMQEME